MIRRSAAQAAQDFADALDGRRPASAEIAELVETAELICASAATVEPGADFAARLRADLMAEAATTLAPARPRRVSGAQVRAAAPAPAPRRTRRRLAGLTTAAVIAVGGVGLVGSSASAMPGDMLYPVKRGVENVQLGLHRGDASNGAYQLELAGKRLQELRSLTDGGSADGSLVVDSLDDFTSRAESGTQRLLTAYAGGDAGAIDTVNDFAASSSVDLADLASLLPADAKDALGLAADTVQGIADQASDACTACDAADVTSLTGAVQKAAGNDLTGTRKSSSSSSSKKGDSSTSSGGSTGGSASGSTGDSSDSGGDSSTTPTQKPIIAPPKTAPPTSLKDVTDPVLGGLLGDDEQQGVVPGLLNGLLGSTPSPKN